MITIERKVLEQALDALESCRIRSVSEWEVREVTPRHVTTALEALREALAQPAAQPTNCRHCGGPETVLCGGQCKPAAQPTEPAKDIGVEQDERVFARIAAMKVQQEPVAWLHVCRKKPELRDVSLRENVRHLAAKGYKPEPLYTRPAVPLTDEQKRNMVKECGLDWHRGYMPLFDGDPTNRYAVLIEAVEAAHKIGGTP
jgi:hypothetical protein